MGLGDLFTDGGSQETKVKLPNYIEGPATWFQKGITKAYNQSTPLNPVQNEALSGIINQARSGNPLFDPSQDFLLNLFQGGGLTPEQSGLAQMLTSGGFVNPATGLAQNFASGGVVNPALEEAKRVALGGDLGSNPFLDQTYKKAADMVGESFRENVVPGLDKSFWSQGRLGSNSYANARNDAEKTLGRNLSELAVDVYGGAYNADKNRQAAALSQYGNLGEAGIQTQLAGTNLVSNLGQQDVANRVTGANLYGSGTGNLFSGVSALPGMETLRYSDLDRLFGVGTTQQDAPWKRIDQATTQLGKLPYGTTTSTSAQMNPLTQGIGLATGIGAIGSASGIGQTFSALSNLMGPAGIAMYSDKYLKENLERVGTTEAGIPVYRYNYLWDDTPRVGVLAQDVAPVIPEAVTSTPSGWLAVDYGKVR